MFFLQYISYFLCTIFQIFLHNISCFFGTIFHVFQHSISCLFGTIFHVWYAWSERAKRWPGGESTRDFRNHMTHFVFLCHRGFTTATPPKAQLLVYLTSQISIQQLRLSPMLLMAWLISCGSTVPLLSRSNIMKFCFQPFRAVNSSLNSLNPILPV